MIELGIRPTRWIVARRAVRAKRAVMLVVFLMACYARLRSALEDVVDVTLGTLERLMLAGQLERCQIVIELGIGPTGGVVARRAVRAKRAVVLVVFLMATHARLRRAFENIVDVAGSALHRDVFPF